jgi:integrase
MAGVPPSKLVDIVQEHLDRKRRREASVTLNELKKFFSAEKNDHSAAYVRQIRHVFSRLGEMTRTKVSDIATQDIEKALHKLPPSHCNLHLRILRAAFNYAVKKGWATVNPIKSLDFAAEPRHGEVEVLTIRQTARLLLTCVKEDHTLLPYHLFGLFAGVRPEELERMLWDHVELEEKHILLPAEVTKIGRRRVIEMEPNLIAWLQWYEKRYGTQRGSIHPPNLRRRLRKIRLNARIVPWIQDVMRHTYASNWLAMHGDINRLLLNMGHYSTAVLWEHYHKAVLRRDGESFWRLTPRTKKSDADAK